MPLVSIIMPIYNVEKYIRDSIESVLNQTFRDFELILVDDGSPDNCPQICDEYAKKSHRVRVYHKVNGGLSSARNIGIELADGKYIIFIDSDDTVEKNMLEKIVGIAEKENADIVIFGIHTMVYRNGILEAEKYGRHQNEILDGHANIEANFTRLCESGMWNFPVDKLYRKSLFSSNNVRSKSYYDGVCEDTIMLYDLFPFVNKICVSNGCYYNYMIRDNQSIVTKFIPDRYRICYSRYGCLVSLMNTFSLENQDRGFLYRQYCIFIIWTYEFMFHRACKMNLLERYRFIRESYSIRKESRDFCNTVYEFIQTEPSYLEISGTSQKVLLNILKKRYFFAWIWHLIALIRRKKDV